MTSPDATGCEVRIDGAWRLVPLAEAHARHRDADMRCPACHGRVRIQGVFTGRGGWTLVHMRTHDGCPHMPHAYSGTPRPHPQPLA